MKQPTLAQVWDVIVFILLLPVVLLMGSRLPGDWAHHHGESLPGTAVVSSLEPVRGGDAVLVDVRSESGQVVATRQEINGDAPRRIGVTFRAQYLPPDASGNMQVYTAGHDPFLLNLAVFVPLLLLWVSTVPFLGVRLIKLGRWIPTRCRRRPTGPYRAGRGYTRE